MLSSTFRKPMTATAQTLLSLLNMKISHADHKLDKLTQLISCKNKNELFDRTISHTNDPSDILIGAESAYLSEHSFDNNQPFIKNMMNHDFNHYLSDDIMVKVDRAAMHSSLETRAPFLDHKIKTSIY